MESAFSTCWSTRPSMSHCNTAHPNGRLCRDARTTVRRAARAARRRRHRHRPQRAARVAAERIKPVTAVLDDPTPLGEDWLAMTQFAAQYYQYPWGEVAINALPPQLRSPPGPRFGASLARLRARRLPPAGEGVQPLELNAAQRDAVERIDATEGFAAWLLHGVTGSGKTEVYCEIVARRFARNPDAQALILVPEINLTPQFEARLRARFPGVELASLHSGLAAAARSGAWLAAHEGRARIILGTRSSIFASLPRLDIDRRRRGARHVVQVRRGRSLLGAGPRDQARPGARHPGDPRLGDTVARDLGACAVRPPSPAEPAAARERRATRRRRVSVQTIDVQQSPPVQGLAHRRARH